MALKSEQEIANGYFNAEWNNVATSGGNQNVKGAAGHLVGVMINASPTSALRLYNGTTSAGSTIASIPASIAAGTFYQYGLQFDTGLTVSAGSADTDITVIYV